ncbi:hypothetical protein V6N13_100449 [Hibiscus sabdariffa]
MIIPGEKRPWNDIDIYLQPFIEELKQLWVGVKTFDMLKKENFTLRAALLWTINDFPTDANLSGWSTKGRYACPCCAAQTCSRWLYNGKKLCYMGHRPWLDENHSFRYEHNLFDGTEEFRAAPEQTTGCMSSEVTSCIIELSNIMKSICGKVLMVEELEKLQDRVALTLCNLKKIFPPSFFTIMVHLLVHLPEEAKVGGPVFYRWMYPIERFLSKLKSYCRNKRYPE